MSVAFVHVEGLVATLVTNTSVPGPMVSQFVGDTDEEVLDAAVAHMVVVATAAARPLTLAVLHGDRRDELTVLPAELSTLPRRAHG